MPEPFDENTARGADAPATPFEERAAVGHNTTSARHQAQCSRPVLPDSASTCPECGVFQPGNQKALKHGARRRQPAIETTNRRRDIRDDMVRRLGGHSGWYPVELTAALDDFAFVRVQMEIVVAHLDTVGPFTERGRRRAALDTYLALSQRAERLAAQIRDFAAQLPTARSDEGAFAALPWLTDDELRTVMEVADAYLALARERMNAGEQTYESFPQGDHRDDEV